MNAMEMAMMPLAGQPESRGASGTAWQPDTSVMHGIHTMAGPWAVMLHYNAFLSFDDQSGPRGGHQVDSENWAMAMGTLRWDADDELMLRGMFTLEPWTVTKRGFPLLFQTGEEYNGQPLVDRQHPHDFFMEVAARYRRVLDAHTAVSLYAGPSGEPALGPPAFMHRASAMDDPAVPIGHHWEDSTHIAFGVATLGVARGDWQLEGSCFNGREPNQNRWDLERPHLDSFSGRLSWNPAPEWSAQVSYGRLASPEALHPEESERRTTASVIWSKPLTDERTLSTTLVWGQNRVTGAPSNALLAELDWQLTRGLTVFGRAEYVEKTGEELVLTPAAKKFPIRQLGAGVVRELLPASSPVELGLGAELTASSAPSTLTAIYGRNPWGGWIFLRLRPARMKPGMQM